MDTRSRSGQSLMELLISIAVGALFVIGAATIIAPSLNINTKAGNVQVQAEFGQELLSNVRAWAGGNWSGVLALATGTANRYYLNTTSSPFTAATSSVGQAVINCGGVATGTMCATYLRYFYLTDVYRDGSGNVTTTASGNYYDPSTKGVIASVQAASSSQPPLIYSLYITRSGNNALSQTTWAGGPGQNNPATFVSSTYATTTSVTVIAAGSLQLATTTSGGSCTFQ